LTHLLANREALANWPHFKPRRIAVLSKGLLMVNYGKSSKRAFAAMGLILRALGQGLKVCLISFDSAGWEFGDLKALEPIADIARSDKITNGPKPGASLLTSTCDPQPEAWILAKEALESGSYDLVVLHELTNLVSVGGLSQGEIVEALKKRSRDVHIMITGDNVPQTLLDEADLITEVEDIS
jgi:cob(I)alamin adenosyltransferase